jgi:hypothetical protein
LNLQSQCASKSANAKAWGVVLCLLLVLMFTAVQATHLHERQGPEAANQCALCLVAHSAISLFSALPSIAVAPSATSEFLSPEECDGASSVYASELYSRPPPTL